MRRLRDCFNFFRASDEAARGHEKSAISPALRAELGGGSCLQSPLKEMRTFWGLLGAWWRSDDWKAAWGTAALVAATTIGLTGVGIWSASIWGDFAGSLADIYNANSVGNAAALAAAKVDMAEAMASTLAALVLEFGLNATRDVSGRTMHRKWRGWLGEQLTKATLRDRNYVHLLSNRAADKNDPCRMPDNIDQRIQESVKNLTGSACWLGAGTLGFISSFGGYSLRLAAISTALPGMAMFGSWASASLAIGAAMLYVPVAVLVANKLAQKLQTLTIGMQTTEGDYRAELNLFTRNAKHIAATNSEDVQKKIIDKSYRPVDRTWRDFTVAIALYNGYNNFQGMLQQKIYSYLPALPGFLSGGLSLSQYFEVSTLITRLISEASWVIANFPEIANLRANVQRVTEVVAAIDTVQETKEFYSRTGVAEIRHGTHNNGDGIVVEGVELMHKGQTEPFLSVEKLKFKPGQFTAVMGPSGCGKTTLVDAVMQLHPYGRGRVTVPENAKALYAAQEAFLPQKVSLKQLVCLPADDDACDDLKVASILEKVGLGKFIGNLKEESYGGKCWNEVLSGGQKQLIVLARVLLHQPDILILDESTSALDAQTKIRFHELIKEHCPGTAAIHIIHDPALLEDTGFYDSLVLLKRDRATKSERPTFTASQYDLGTRKSKERALHELYDAIGLKDDKVVPFPVVASARAPVHAPPSIA